jgi:hypothetical protein
METGMHPAPAEFTDAEIAADPLLHFFHYRHLPAQLQATSRNFFMLARWIVTTLPRNAERTVALRKLLEAKDCAVRANLPPPGAKPVRSDAEPELDEPREVGGHDVMEEPIDFNRD